MHESTGAGSETALDRLLRATAVLYLAHLVQGGALKLPAPGGVEDVLRGSAIAAMGLGVLLGGRLLRRRVFWLAIGAVFFLATASHPDRVGNHHWVLGYFAVALALCCDPSAARMRDLVSLNLRWMLAAIMAFAALQKLASPAIRDGSFVAYMLATGKLLGPVFALCEPCGEAIAKNEALLAAASTTYPGGAPAVPLHPPLPGMSAVTVVVTVAMVGIELLLAALFAFPWGRSLRLPVLFAFVATLGFMRPEFVFAAWLALSGLWLCPPSARGLPIGFGIAFVAWALLSLTRIV